MQGAEVAAIRCNVKGKDKPHKSGGGKGRRAQVHRAAGGWYKETHPGQREGEVRDNPGAAWRGGMSRERGAKSILSGGSPLSVKKTKTTKQQKKQNVGGETEAVG